VHIQLITGAIGAGKTAQVVSWIKFGADYKDRVVYHHSIHWVHPHDPGIRVYCDSPRCMVCPDDPDKVTGLKAANWHEWAEPNAVLMFDECQFIWPRSDAKSAVPPGVDAMTKLRHMKITMFLMTPHPMKLHVDARRSATIHHHFSKTGLGRKCKTFDEACDDPSNGFGAESKFDPIPKKTFGMYISSESGHTKVKRPIPRKLVMMVGFLVALVVGAGWLFSSGGSPLDENGRLSLVSQANDVPVNEGATAGAGVTNTLQQFASGVGSAVSGVDGGNGIPPMLTRAYYEQILDSVPMVPGYPETAPMYSHLVGELRPAELPRLAGCIQAVGTKRCNCYDQDGKRYPTTLQRCEAFFDGRDRGYIPPAALAGP